MEKLLVLDHFQDNVWNKQRILSLLNYIHNNQSKKIYKQLFYNVLFTFSIQLHLINILSLNNDVILRIYWEELKLVRLRIKFEYDRVAEKLYDQTLNLDKYIVELFRNESIHIDRSNVLESISNYINENKYNVNIQCKICMDRNVDSVLVHNDHVCTVCEECALIIDKENGCPFCRKSILDVKKLFIR